MIGWLHSIDIALYRFVNTSLSNPFFDRLMPFVSDSPWFACLLVVAAVFMICKGCAR